MAFTPPENANVPGQGASWLDQLLFNSQFLPLGTVSQGPGMWLQQAMKTPALPTAAQSAQQALPQLGRLDVASFLPQAMRNAGLGGLAPVGENYLARMLERLGLLGGAAGLGGLVGQQPGLLPPQPQAPVGPTATPGGPGFGPQPIPGQQQGLLPLPEPPSVPGQRGPGRGPRGPIIKTYRKVPKSAPRPRVKAI